MKHTILLWTTGICILWLIVSFIVGCSFVSIIFPCIWAGILAHVIDKGKE